MPTTALKAQRSV